MILTKQINSYRYWSLSNDELFEIPVPELSSPGCIIGVWVTNRVKHKDFIIERLFPYWKVNYVATWYWVKVTVLIYIGNNRLDLFGGGLYIFLTFSVAKCQ